MFFNIVKTRRSTVHRWPAIRQRRTRWCGRRGSRRRNRPQRLRQPKAIWS